MTDHYDDETQFWDTPQWVPSDPVPRVRARDRTGSFERTRSHHIVRHHDAPPTNASTLDNGVLAEVDAWDGVDRWVEPLEKPRRAGGVSIDPTLLRIGAVGMVGVLMIPIALALRDDPGEAMSAQHVVEVAATVAPVALGNPATSIVTVPPSVAAAPIAAALIATAPPSTAAAEGRAQPVVVREPYEPECAGTYTVIANDFWNRFPRSSGASVQEWLNANGANAETPLFVGDELCIPAGATAPAPPAPPTAQSVATTTVPSTAVPTTQRPATAPVTAAAPVVTTAPTTRPPVASAPVVTTTRPTGPTDPASIEAIIREVWPDDLEERALTIARRESGLRPGVHNWCCYGVFAIYFDMGRNFLPGLGITQVEQLFDARANVTAAYHLYTLSGWKPWVQTDPG